MTNVPTLTIEECRDQLAAAELEVSRIQARMDEIAREAGAEGIAQRERELAAQLLDGADLATIVPPRLTTQQVKRALAALDAVMAEAQARVGQAQGALRRAKVAALDELFQAEAQRFDQAAADLVAAYARTSAMGERVVAARGVNPLTMAWGRLTLPRAIPKDTGSPWLPGLLHAESGAEVSSGLAGNRGRAEIAELLRDRGVEL